MLSHDVYALFRDMASEECVDDYRNHADERERNAVNQHDYQVQDDQNGVYESRRELLHHSHGNALVVRLTLLEVAHVTLRVEHYGQV